MSAIDPANRLAALMQVQLATLRGRVANKTGARTAVGGKAARMLDPGAQGALRLLAVDPHDPQRERKVFRIFLESLLLAELGADLVNDPAFATMVDDVQRQMEADNEVAAAIRQATQLLMNPASAKSLGSQGGVDSTL